MNKKSFAYSLLTVALALIIVGNARAEYSLGNLVAESQNNFTLGNSQNSANSIDAFNAFAENIAEQSFKARSYQDSTDLPSNDTSSTELNQSFKKSTTGAQNSDQTNNSNSGADENSTLSSVDSTSDKLQGADLSDDQTSNSTDAADAGFLTSSQVPEATDAVLPVVGTNSSSSQSLQDDSSQPNSASTQVPTNFKQPQDSGTSDSSDAPSDTPSDGSSNSQGTQLHSTTEETPAEENSLNQGSSRADGLQSNLPSADNPFSVTNSTLKPDAFQGTGPSNTDDFQAITPKVGTMPSSPGQNTSKGSAAETTQGRSSDLPSSDSQGRVTASSLDNSSANPSNNANTVGSRDTSSFPNQPTLPSSDNADIDGTPVFLDFPDKNKDNLSDGYYSVKPIDVVDYQDATNAGSSSNSSPSSDGTSQVAGDSLDNSVVGASDMTNSLGQPTTASNAKQSQSVSSPQASQGAGTSVSQSLRASNSSPSVDSADITTISHRCRKRRRRLHRRSLFNSFGETSA